MDLNSHNAAGDLSQADVASRVRSFVTRSLARNVLDAEDFFETGLVSSLFGMQLVTFLEESFDLKVGDEDLVLGNFASIENISRFVARKRTCR
jgi:methoxymalonate biosynthesis acyl carrier protein